MWIDGIFLLPVMNGVVGPSGVEDDGEARCSEEIHVLTGCKRNFSPGDVIFERKVGGPTRSYGKVEE